MQALSSAFDEAEGDFRWAYFKPPAAQTARSTALPGYTMTLAAAMSLSGLEIDEYIAASMVLRASAVYWREAHKTIDFA